MSRKGLPPRGDAAFALGCCAVLAGYNNIAGVWPSHRRWYPAVNLAAAAVALSAAAASGLAAGDLGLRPDRLPQGFRLGWRLSVPVVASLAVAGLLPATRPMLRDQRNAALSGRLLAYQALVRIPFGTVIWEETAFRGVLQAALRRVMPEPAAIAVTSGVFGIWHIRPTAEALRINKLTRSAGTEALAITAAVAATGTAGALLSWLRARSGSLAAPVMLHLAANCGGVLASTLCMKECKSNARPRQRKNRLRSR
jgi:membrane protease YdiL (CAAX protease family)